MQAMCFSFIRDLLRKKKYGYETEFKMLNAKDYGVPENRKRIILVGKKGKSTGFYFQSCSGKPSRTPAYHPIGNAVPVLLAETIAEKLKENW